MLRTIRRFIRERSGATAIEYGLIAALIAVASIGALQAFGTELIDIFNYVAAAVNGSYS